MALIGVALIGGGLFAKEQHMPAIIGSKILTLKAVYSRSQKSARDTAALSVLSDTEIDIYSDDQGPGKGLHDLLARSDVEAVILALPIMVQPTMIKAALRAGKHVLAEKPLAPNVLTGKEVLEVYQHVRETKQVTLGVSENWRFKPAHLYAAAEGLRLGAVQQFTARMFYHMAADSIWCEAKWRNTPEYQGGFLLDGGVHFAALVRLLLGTNPSSKASSVWAICSQIEPHLSPADTVSALFRTRGGSCGTFQVSAGSQFQGLTYNFAYEHGTVVLNGDKVTVKEKGSEAVVKVFPPTRGVREAVEQWAEGLRTGKPDDRHSIEEALGDLEFMEGIFESSRAGGAEQTYRLQ